MSHSLKTLLKLTAASAALALLVGCAAQQAEIDEVRSMAEAAMDEASAARFTAEGAEMAASRAQDTADENSEKIDRMFERSMYK
ncbi:hypothetical protein GJ672_04635 [Spiribacter sp. 2438]|uniref:Lpp/OprI family alanine-zipper lipoprotein n=1 Tax=Spiribacter sp. 2438 TaxID=2666185 RepID=UPI0012B02B3D|nr:Lpp/OprI family alanine-zipper lipoprotein [Spiribacter sp. 2438]QGM21625.1 hypothetical protein GJ672_04635 [Spiribacter sp. 2438]